MIFHRFFSASVASIGGAEQQKNGSFIIGEMSGKEIVKKYLLLGLEKKASGLQRRKRDINISPRDFAFSISSVQGHFKCKRFDCCDDCDGHFIF
jgi:hypothetical protein